jgi:hypothetical protein
MNVPSGVFENKINLAICIYPSDGCNHKPLLDKMIDYTLFYAYRIKELSTKLDIIQASSIDQALKDNSHYDHILFMAAGVRIYDSSIIFDIEKEIQDNSNYVAAAHILDWKENWYELHQQFVLVNVKNWKFINQPLFGDSTPGTDNLVVLNRSELNYHDDYTPAWIQDSRQRKPQFHTRPGWNFIDKALKNNLKIINWNQAIRNKRTYYYPESQSEEFYSALMTRNADNITNFNQNKLLQELSVGVSDQIWAVNSENMNVLSNGEKYEIIALPASGFKYLDIFKSNALIKLGQIVIYDYNTKSLDWIKHIYQSQETDIEKLIRSFVHKDNLIWFGHNNPPILYQNKADESFLNSFQITVDYYGGRSKFIEYLRLFRSSSVVFIQTDLYNNPYDLITKLDIKKSLLHISNIFATDFMIANIGLEQSYNHLNRLLDLLHPNTRVVGHTPKGTFLS